MVHLLKRLSTDIICQGLCDLALHTHSVMPTPTHVLCAVCTSLAELQIFQVWSHQVFCTSFSFIPEGINILFFRQISAQNPSLKETLLIILYKANSEPWLFHDASAWSSLLGFAVCVECRPSLIIPLGYIMLYMLHIQWAEHSVCHYMCSILICWLNQ